MENQWCSLYRGTTIIKIILKSTKNSLLRTNFLVHSLISMSENLKSALLKFLPSCTTFIHGWGSQRRYDSDGLCCYGNGKETWPGSY